jgi:hypothetical protein
VGSAAELTQATRELSAERGGLLFTRDVTRLVRIAPELPHQDRRERAETADRSDQDFILTSFFVSQRL